MFSNKVLMDMDTPSPEPLVYLLIHSFMYVCRSPQKEALLHTGKNIWSPSTEPHADGRPTYSWLRPGSPRGSLMTLLSLSQCHAATHHVTQGRVQYKFMITRGMDEGLDLWEAIFLLLYTNVPQISGTKASHFLRRNTTFHVTISNISNYVNNIKLLKIFGIRPHEKCIP